MSVYLNGSINIPGTAAPGPEGRLFPIPMDFILGDHEGENQDSEEILPANSKIIS